MKLKEKSPDQYSFSKRWSPELKAAGFVPVSTFFLENYHRLKPYHLTYGEAMFVIHLMQFKWDESKPYPAYKTIAARMHVSDKTARRWAAELEGKGYLHREKRVAQTNLFDLSGLMRALADLKASQDRAKKLKGGAD